MAVGTLDLRGWTNKCLTKQAIPYIENKYKWAYVLQLKNYN